MAHSPKLAREKDIEKMCIELLRIKGVWCQKIHSGEMYVAAGPARYRVKLADKGTPDILACIRGRFVGIEVKDSPEEADRWHGVIERWKATGPDDKTRTIKKTWEREICQHLQHEGIRAAAGYTGGEVIICSSPEELLKDLEMLQAEYDAQDKILAEHMPKPAQQK